MLILSALVVLFLLGWRYVFPDNLMHRVYDAAVQGVIDFGLYIASTKGGHVKFLKDKGFQGGIQGAKIFLANFQVDDNCD